MSHTNSHTISPIAAAVSAALAAPAALAQVPTEEGDTGTLEEIIVTATKREQNIQNIGSSVQALPEAMLRELGALSTEDYVRFMPEVNWINFSSGGSNAIIFRGVNTSTSGFIAPQSSAVYLGEIPLTSTAGAQPEIRMMDIARVEALAGPQGTLFGASAQAGILRIIPNRPDLSQFEGRAEAMFRTGETSDVSHNVDVMLNLPLVEDVFGIRFAAQSAEDGGYIDNVLGHTPDMKFGVPFTGNVSSWGQIENSDVAEENWNSVDHISLRISARWDMTENWSATLTYDYGDTEAFGDAAYNPFVGDLQTINFIKNHSRDEWDLTALVIEADLGFAQFVSSTSFYENQRDYTTDGTWYFKYYMQSGWMCDDRGASDPLDPATGSEWDNPITGRIVNYANYCPTPVNGSVFGLDQTPDMIGVVEGPYWSDRFSQEFRLSHQGETFDWLAGLYYEDSNDSWQSVWMQSTTPYAESMGFAVMEEREPESHNGGFEPTHHWHSYDDTDWEQKAVFGELTWHATDALSFTIGGRYFETTNTKIYTKILEGGTGPDGRQIGSFTQPSWIGNDLPQTGTIEDFVPKFGVTYNMDDDKMVYGLYSVGFRSGGVNRANKFAQWDRTLFGQTWDPDKLNNYEIGYRSRWADNTVQLNLTAFYMDWEDFLTEVVDPSKDECIDPNEAGPLCPISGNLPWLSIVGNSGDAHASGVTAELDWVPSDRWVIGGNVRFLEAEIDSGPGFGSDITEGLRLPNSPELQGALWATYSWPVQFVPGGAEMFLRGQWSYTGDSLTHLVPSPETSANPSFTNDSYSLADIRLGLMSPDGDWQVDVFVNNVTDERPQLSQGSRNTWAWGRTGEYDNYLQVWTGRPREYGIRFMSRWGN